MVMFMAEKEVAAEEEKRPIEVLKEKVDFEALKDRVDMKALEERVDKLEEIIETGVKDMEAFAREKPTYALGIALLGGVFFGFLIGAAVSRRGD